MCAVRVIREKNVRWLVIYKEIFPINDFIELSIIEVPFVMLRKDWLSDVLMYICVPLMINTPPSDSTRHGPMDR